MHRSVLRSAVERTAAGGVLRGAAAAGRALPAGTAAAAAAAFFSTTASQAKLKDVSGRQDRLAAAASAVGALGSDGAAAPAPSRAPAGVTDARALGAAAGSDGAAGSGGEGKIINVRSLPRRTTDFSTATRFPRADGAAGAAATGRPGGRFAARPPPTNRTNTNPAFQTGPPAGAGRSGSGGNKRTSSGRGRRGTAAAGRDAKKQRQQAASPMADQMDDDELEWLETYAEDKATVYEPAATTAEGLAAGLKGHGPAVPWSAASSSAAAAAAAGVTEAALRAMRVLSGGWAFSAGSTDVLGAEVARERLRLGQRTFFDSAAERAAVEAVLHGSRRAQRRRAQWAAAPETAGTPVPSLIAPPSAATRAAIVETAVRGVYAAPPEPPAAVAAAAASGARGAFADPAVVFASFARYQAQDHTYTAEHARRFEERARGLLARGQAKA